MAVVRRRVLIDQNRRVICRASDAGRSSRSLIDDEYVSAKVGHTTDGA